MQSNNTSGLTGVSWHKASQKWQSHIKFDGKVKYLGLFETKEGALKARKNFLQANKHLGFTERHGKPSK